mgnify:CR=1 FL=1
MRPVAQATQDQHVEVGTPRLLPIGGGDLSDVQCIGDDIPAPSFTDDEEPAPGEGFLYLMRTGGPEPGTWNGGGEVEDRDANLDVCS